MMLISAEKPKSQAANKSPKMAEAVMVRYPQPGRKAAFAQTRGFVSLTRAEASLTSGR
jgi:hypothetical protein